MSIRDAVTRPAIFARGQYSTLVGVAVLIMVLSAVLTSSSSANLLNLWLAYSIAGLGFYWIFAMGGRFAFSQTFMMALGGYTTAYLDGRGVGFIGAVAGAVAASAVAAAVIGVILWRTEHLYFALGTLAVTEISTVVFGKTSEFTGVNGNLTGVGYPRLFGHTFNTDGDVFWIFAVVLVVVLLLTVWVRRSPLTRRLTAIRDLPTVSRTVGLPVDGLRMQTFVIGSAIGGLSGALITHWQGFIGVDSFGIDLGIGLFLIVILGGLSSHWGVLIGAAFYVAVPELLSGLAQYMSIIYGGLLLIVILLAPSGLIGVGRAAAQRAAWRLDGTKGAEL